MGPGFDCLGIALDIWNTVTVEVGDPRVERGGDVIPAKAETGFEIIGQGEDELPRDESNLVFQSIARIFEECGQTLPPLSVRCGATTTFPRRAVSDRARPALVSGLTIGNELCGESA